jgi:hypothetical protein
LIHCSSDDKAGEGESIWKGEISNSVECMRQPPAVDVLRRSACWLRMRTLRDRPNPGSRGLNSLAPQSAPLRLIVRGSSYRQGCESRLHQAFKMPFQVISGYCPLQSSKSV